MSGCRNLTVDPDTSFGVLFVSMVLGVLLDVKLLLKLLNILVVEDVPINDPLEEGVFSERDWFTPTARGGPFELSLELFLRDRDHDFREGSDVDTSRVFLRDHRPTIL